MFEDGRRSDSLLVSGEVALDVMSSGRVILVICGGSMLPDGRRDDGLLLGRLPSPEGIRGSWLGLSRDFSSSRSVSMDQFQ